MMASSWVGTTRPEGRELRACGLAALAESGVLVLPLWLVLTEARGLKIGVMALAVPFVAVYVGGAMLACRFRASRNVAFGAAVLATLGGIWLGHGDLNRTVFAVLVCLLVSFRLVTLALRDWRLPIHAEVGWFALALDHSKRPVGALASNMGHCLWSGIVDDDKASLVAARLAHPRMWTGWGLRTMAADEMSFDPTSYHCGSVWPHDSAIAIAGMARYGQTDSALAMLEGLLSAADHFDGRLPELFLGIDRKDVVSPVPYPTSCSPQAWAAAAPFLLLRVLLGLNPNVPAGVVELNPTLPDGMDRLIVRGVRLWDARFDVCCREGAVDVTDLPSGLRRTPTG